MRGTIFGARRTTLPRHGPGRGRPARDRRGAGRRARRAAAAPRGTADAAALRAPARDAQPQVRPARRAAGVAEAALAGAPGDRRAVLRRARRDPGDRAGRAARAGPLVVDRPWVQGP